MENDDIRKSMLILRQCAIDSGYRLMALACQSSLVRLAGDETAKRLVEMIKRKRDV
jgi:hypothetical protein